MRAISPILVLALLLPASAPAQVVVNPAALAQLAGITAPPRVIQKLAPLRPRKILTHRVRPSAVAQPRAVGVAKSRPRPPAPIQTTSKPPVPVVKPMPAPPPAVIDFAPGSAALPTGAPAILHPYCQAGGVLGIDARAPANADDPSAAMRLSFNRAMAVRAALLSCGVAAADIIPRAYGAVPGQNDNQTVLTEAEK